MLTLILFGVLALQQVDQIHCGRKGVVEQYAKQQKAAILYFKLKGNWNETLDLVPPAKKHNSLVNGDKCPALKLTPICLSSSKIMSFLKGKYIPRRDKLPEDADETPVKGRFFKMKSARGSDPVVLMADLVAYLISRPREAVPKPVRDLLRPPLTSDNNWPGSMLPRSAFTPEPKKVDLAGVDFDGHLTGGYIEQDIEPFRITRNNVVMEVLTELNMSNPYAQMDYLTSQVNVFTEEMELTESATIKRMLLVAMCSMFLLVPITFLWVCSRIITNPEMIVYGRYRGPTAEEHKPHPLIGLLQTGLKNIGIHVVPKGPPLRAKSVSALSSSLPSTALHEPPVPQYPNKSMADQLIYSLDKVLKAPQDPVSSQVEFMDSVAGEGDIMALAGVPSQSTQPHLSNPTSLKKKGSKSSLRAKPAPSPLPSPTPAFHPCSCNS